jgi:hypothetical protein
MLLDEGIEDRLHLFVLFACRHLGLLGQLDEIVDGERRSVGKFRLRVPHQVKRAAEAGVLVGERALLRRQKAVERRRTPRQQLHNARDWQTELPERENGVQRRDLLCAIGAPARLRTDGRQQAAGLVEAERLGTDAQAARRFSGAEMVFLHSGHGRFLDRPKRLWGLPQGQGQELFSPGRHHSGSRIIYII